jgi:hypothetical protein
VQLGRLQQERYIPRGNLVAVVAAFAQGVQQDAQVALRPFHVAAGGVVAPFHQVGHGAQHGVLQFKHGAGLFVHHALQVFVESHQLTPLRFDKQVQFDALY